MQVGTFSHEKRLGNGSNLIDNGGSPAIMSSTDNSSRRLTCIYFAKPSSLGVTEPFLTQKRPFRAVLSRSSQNRALTNPVSGVRKQIAAVQGTNVVSYEPKGC
jgi:hypothetical protein